MFHEKFSEFSKIIEKSEKIVILFSRPDGDSIGCANGLQKFLKRLGKAVEAHSYNQIPEYLRFLVEKGEVKYISDDNPDLQSFDTVILVDTNSVARSLNMKEAKFGASTKFICIDHHSTSSNQSKFDLEMIDESAESACGMIADLIEYYEKRFEKIFLDSDTSFNLFAGIVSDTDFFGYSTVSKETFRRASYLRQFDFDIDQLIEKFRETLSLKPFNFVAKYLPKVIVNTDLKYAYLKIIKKDLEEGENLAVINEATNFINRAIIRIINEVDSCFILKEVDETKTSIAFRLHNNGNKIDLSKIAAKFGGGGHQKAAGVLVEKPIKEVEESVIKHLEKILTSK